MDLQQTVNALADVQSEIGKLKAQEGALKGYLIESGYEVVEGDTHRAVVADVTRNQINWKLIAEKLGASRQLVTAHTRTQSYTTVRLYEGEAE
jgi:hypothetical protein